jgi:putative transposase
MARPPRIIPSGLVVHVINRGNDKRRLFLDRTDYQRFLDLLYDGCRKFPVLVIAFCLMPTHWHLVLVPLADGAVSAYLHWVTTKHSLQFRKRSGTIGHGHVYQSRFGSFPVQTGAYYYNVINYVDSNARRSGLVSRAEAWEWSSAHERAFGGRLLSPGPIPLPDNWLDLINSLQPRALLEDIRTAVRGERPYGEPEWVKAKAAELGLSSRLRPRGRPAGK